MISKNWLAIVLQSPEKEFKLSKAEFRSSASLTSDKIKLKCTAMTLLSHEIPGMTAVTQGPSAEDLLTSVEQRIIIGLRHSRSFSPISISETIVFVLEMHSLPVKIPLMLKIYKYLI